MNFLLSGPTTIATLDDVQFCGGIYDHDRQLYVVPAISADQVTRLCETYSLSCAIDDLPDIWMARAA